MVGGFLISVGLVVATLYVGTWFGSAVQFADAHSLDAARTARPLVCSFNIIDDGNGKQSRGTIRQRDGYMLFDINDKHTTGEVVQWAVEIDMNDPGRMMTQARPGDDFLSLDNYPDLRVKVTEDLKKIIANEKIHCAPWWSAMKHQFYLQPIVALL